MKAIDFRNETFSQIQGRLDNDRLSVLEALKARGPLTTRALAEAMGWDVLNVRPRVTELAQLGAVVVEGAAGREGIYRALSLGEWADWFEREHQAAADGGQMVLGL